jgi:nicotinate-nucleotide adenylyltransferase
MKIGIFGGSFNPPHKMHLDICRQLIDNSYLDKIIFVPTGVKYGYKNNLLPNDIRYNLIKLITCKYSDLDVSSFEFQDREIHTCETLEYFRKLYPDDEIYFICGADNLSYIDKWSRGEYILNNYKIIVISRNTDNIDEILNKYKNYNTNIILSNIKPVDISSTYIRDCIKNNKYNDIYNLVDKDVLNYIINNNLYK